MNRLRRVIFEFGIGGLVLGTIVLSSDLWADGSAALDILMTAQTIHVSKLGGDLNVNAPLGGSGVSNQILFQNDGDGNETFVIRITTVTGSWSLVSTQPGQNQFRLFAIWHWWNVQPTVDEFQENDILTMNDIVSSETTFFNDFEPQDHFPAGQDILHNSVNGVAIPPATLDYANSIRYLFFRYDAPASITPDSNGVAMDYIVTAIAAQ